MAKNIYAILFNEKAGKIAGEELDEVKASLYGLRRTVDETSDLEEKDLNVNFLIARDSLRTAKKRLLKIVEELIEAEDSLESLERFYKERRDKDEQNEKSNSKE